MKLATRELQIELTRGKHISIRDLDFPKGKKILIQGPSGCGKTSLLHVLGLLRQVEKGQILFDGRAPNTSADQFRLQNFGFIFQRLSLIPHLTVEENILLDEVDQVDIQILQKLDIWERRAEQVGLFSLGEQQRVAIARTLHKKPKILFADEPTSSLDRPTAEKVASTLAGLSDSTVVTVSHDERIVPYFETVISWAELLK
jgi:putative ABC transport system ATP-binding protein